MSGKVYLVGAGPGRADLITVRGLNLLRQADVVVYDRLIAQELLDEARPDASLIYAGKVPGQHTMPQEKINQILVTEAGAGRQVVRLKGGDPFVFGRGGEEALDLVEAGIPFEIVPGVSSSIAAPAFAGVPVTHRGISTVYAVIAGYEDPTKDSTMTDWAALASVQTLVILMGMRQIRAICDALLAAGREATTPAIVISHGLTAKQRSEPATLETLPDMIQEKGLTSPSVIVIGEVAALHQTLNWFEPDALAKGFVPTGGLVGTA